MFKWDNKNMPSKTDIAAEQPVQGVHDWFSHVLLFCLVAASWIKQKQ